MEVKSAGTYTNTVPLDGDGSRRSSPRMGGRYLDIVYSFLMMTIPMIVFSALLLGLIYRYQVVHGGFASENLRVAAGQDDSSVLYVRLSATTLTTVASWSSTLAPILVGFAITLISYPVARTLLLAVNGNRPVELPTPYQLSLMLRMVTSGGPASLWHWTIYAGGWKGRRQAQPRALKTMVFMLALGLILSLLVFITDTWLHFTTKTINFIQTTPASLSLNHSYALSESCTDVSRPWATGCTLNPAAAVVFNMDGATALQLLNNISDTMMVKTIDWDDGQFAYLGNAPQAQLVATDYTANTWAVQTRCEPVTSKCMDNDTFYGASTPYRCPFAFEGDLNRQTWAMAYFTDSTGSSNETQLSGIDNPYYFAIAAAVNEETGRVSEALETDPEIDNAVHGAMVFALFCNATVYDVEYSSVNNTVTRFNTAPSNNSVANFIQGTQQFSSYAGDTVLSQAASLAGFSDSAQEVADKMAIAYSRVALSVAAAAFVPRPALEAQRREVILVARVPKAPLAALLVANLLLALLGVVLTFIALVALRGETGEVQARLSIPGLVADCFEGARAKEGKESVEELFQEYEGQRGSKVGIVKTQEGGYAFGTW